MSGEWLIKYWRIICRTDVGISGLPAVANEDRFGSKQWRGEVRLLSELSIHMHTQPDIDRMTE